MDMPVLVGRNSDHFYLMNRPSSSVLISASFLMQGRRLGRQFGQTLEYLCG